MRQELYLGSRPTGARKTGLPEKVEAGLYKDQLNRIFKITLEGTSIYFRLTLLFALPEVVLVWRPQDEVVANKIITSLPTSWDKTAKARIKLEKKRHEPRILITGPSEAIQDCP